MEILYCKGKDNVVTDALSRIMNTMSFTILENLLLQEIQEAQQEDPFTQQIKQGLNSRMEKNEDLALSTSSFTRKASEFANFSISRMGG